jgi:hypothetical protein
MGPRCGMDVLQKRKISLPAGIRTSDLAAHNIVTIAIVLSLIMD